MKNDENEDELEENEVDEEDEDDDEEEDEEERIEKEKLRIAQEEEKEHSLARLFETLGLKPFPECIVSRKEWAAEPPRSKGLPLKHPVVNLVFTYTTGKERCEQQDECVKAVQDLQQRHMTEGGMSDIGFNFVVGGDLRVYEGRGWYDQPDPDFQFPELKGKRLDIGFIGDFTPAKDELPWAMAGMAIELAHYGVGQGYLMKEYRLVETQSHLSLDDYEAGKEEVRPDLQMRFERYWPGMVVKTELPWENPEATVPPEEYEDED